MNAVRPPIALPAESRPALSVAISSISPSALTSQTADAPAYWPSDGGSPDSAMAERRPSMCAPMRSDCSAIRLRSREAKCSTASSPVSCCTRAANAMGLMRTEAMGLSPTSTQSAPASRRAAAARSPASALRPCGGSSSAESTQSPRSSMERSR